MTRQEAFQLLGLKPGATLDQVKRAYRKLAMQCHPDLNHSPDAERKMKQLNEALEALARPAPVQRPAQPETYYGPPVFVVEVWFQTSGGTADAATQTSVPWGWGSPWKNW